MQVQGLSESNSTSTQNKAKWRAQANMHVSIKLHRKSMYRNCVVNIHTRTCNEASSNVLHTDVTKPAVLAQLTDS